MRHGRAISRPLMPGDLRPAPGDAAHIVAGIEPPFTGMTRAGA